MANLAASVAHAALGIVVLRVENKPWNIWYGVSFLLGVASNLAAVSGGKFHSSSKYFRDALSKYNP